jgi:ABC-type transport system involved in multi-copper enzyme maturation permease subunit
VVLSIREFQEHAASYQEMLQQRVEAQLRGSGRPLGRTAEPGLRVIRRPSPGAVLATGIERAIPAAWEFTPAGIEALAPYTRTELSISDRGVGDLAGIIAGLGGLLALWLGVSTVESDKTAGRIAAMRALPAGAGTMAVVRLAGGTLALAVVVAAWCVTVGLTTRAFMPAVVDIPPSTHVWLAAPVLFYMTLMFALGTSVGAAARDGVSASVTAFLIWLAVVFVIPQTTQLITRSVIEVPTRSSLDVERREHLADAVRLLENEVGAAMAKIWPAVMSPTREQQGAAYLAIGEQTWTSGWTRIRAAAELEQRQGLEMLARDSRLKRWMDSVNPRSWLLESMAEVAGTGRSMEAAWTAAITSHDQDLNEHLFSNRVRVNPRVQWKGQALILAFDRRPAPRFSELPPFVEPQGNYGMWKSPIFGGLAAYTSLAMASAYFWLRSRLR